MPDRVYTLAQATRLCAFRRTNSFRERFLSSEEGRQTLVVGYDARGRLLLDADAVDDRVERLADERKRLGNWRARNLGAYAKPGKRKGTKTEDAV